MTTFDQREHAFEQKFEHDEELKFKARARKNKMLGLWAAGLIVHGPLMGLLQIELARRSNPGKTAASFEFRALSPAFAGAPFTVAGRREADGSVTTWIANAKGGLAQQGKATFK